MDEVTLPRTSGVEYRFLESAPMYCAGDDGSVWSSYRGRWKRLKEKRTAFGYRSVRIFYADRPRWRFVHRLVLEAFVGACPVGMECRHFPNNDRADNRLRNLQWGSKESNARDRIVHGTQKMDKIGAKITEDVALCVRRERAEKSSTVLELSHKYALSRVAIVRILRGKSWTDAGGPIVGPRDLQPIKVTDVVREQIKSLAGVMTQREIAKQYGMSQSNVSKVLIACKS